MENMSKMKLGLAFSITAFTLTTIVSTIPGFVELNPIMRLGIESLSQYYLVLLYGIAWAGIFTLFKYAEVNMEYAPHYIANIVLFIGFFDVLNDVVSLSMWAVLQ